ncbi:MAG: thiamine biosynthesis protein ThiF, partial [Deltaproteobacteria bacterium]|nr:thiamine biosynthesis protein ThiF [Deltaproteobacteria bacterium]
MGLSNQQIERYARQIIVPGVGGIAQERLIAARLMLAGKAADVASMLAYMVGAGVGEIWLQLSASDMAEQDLLIMR